MLDSFNHFTHQLLKIIILIMTDSSIIINRLRKNLKIRKSLVKSLKTEAYRLYEKDIPEYPFIIDVYKDQVVIYEKGKKFHEDETEQILNARLHKKEIISAIEEIFNIPLDQIIFKERFKKEGKVQYEKFSRKNHFFEIQEDKCKFLINLHDYLDTGLFLDHRPLRSILLKESSGKSVLNLFAYTGSLSVASAIGGGVVTTVDMSKTYLEWAQENFKINEIDSPIHKFTHADATNYIMNLENQFDIIILDPPSFSNSKRMEDTFDVQRDHFKLIDRLMKNLNENGTLYFSNNNRKFKLDPLLKDLYKVSDISERTIPKDFRDLKIHCCFKIQNY